MIKNVNWWRNSLWPICIPCLLLLPTLFTGFILDDHFHQAIMSDTLDPLFAGKNPLTDLFTFLPTDEQSRHILRDRGVLPWWAPEGIRVNFFRPLTAVTHMIDFWLWPNLPFMQHMHNFFWLLLANWGVRRFYLATGLSSIPLALALLFYLVEDAHVMSVGWIANRNILIAVFFGCLSILGFIRWRLEGQRLSWPILMMSLSLLSTEAGLSTFAYILAWSLVYEPSLRHTINAVLPFVILIVVWRLIYVSWGYGTWGSGLYDDPSSDLLGFLIVLIQRIPLLVISLWAQIPADLYVFLDTRQIWMMTTIGIMAMLTIFYVLRPLLSRDPNARFWALGTLFALVPMTAALPMNRLLFFAGIGSCALLGLYLNTLKRPQQHILFWIHGPLAIILCLGGAFGLKVLKEISDLPTQHLPSDLNSDDHIIFITGSALTEGFSLIKPLLNGATFPERISTLAPLAKAKRLTRLDVSSFEITAQEPWFQLPIETIFRSPRVIFSEINHFVGPGFIAIVTESSVQGLPKRVKFHFDKPLEDPQYRWMCYRAFTLKACNLPKIGKSMDLPGILPL